MTTKDTNDSGRVMLRDLETVDIYAKVAGRFSSMIPAPPVVAGAVKRLIAHEERIARAKASQPPPP